MTWKDVKFRIRGFFGGGTETASRRPDGGTSCYRPVQRKNRQEENLAREKAAEYAASQPQTPNIHTGFTGMNPPSDGRGAVRNDPYGFGGTQTGFAGIQTAYGEYGNGFRPQEDRTGYAGGPNEGMQTPDNISYMPGMAVPDAGSTYTHVEHILAVTSLQSCYEAIECMKNGETLIVTLDVVGSESESLRCQDMLAGAAFTLQCTVRNLPSAGVIVIAPPGVKILPEQRIRRYEEPAGYSAPVQPWPAEPYTPRRERRVSQNPVGWDNAGAGNQGYNPYTGSMPAAAGAYSAYGGY